MRKATVHRIDKQHADVIAAAGLQRTGRGIGHIAHLVRHAADLFARFAADILLAVERLADRSHGDTAGLCNVLHGYHGDRLRT